jgi:antitoxin component YwqK of YwqJK toxin-antitoxin module
VKIEYCGKKGKQQGSAQIYYHSSKLQKEMTYKNGVQVDTMNMYFENGIYRLFYENGQLQIDEQTRDNNLDGFCLHYNEEGKKPKKENTEFVSQKAYGKSIIR